MYFNSTVYGLFFVTVFVLYWLLRRNRTARYALLLVASWFFYGSWNWKYLSLIWISTLLDYWISGRLAELDRTDLANAAKRRGLLLVSLVGNLGILGVFKYYDFFRNNIEDVFGLDLPFLNALLPVGISFYTFQTLSYTIDVYRGTLKPARNLFEFALFVAFFPQLVAGPIVRAADFLPQLDREPVLDDDGVYEGLFRIAEGLIKKVVIADVLGAGLVKGVFDSASTDTGFHVLLGVYGYALQIYGDFAGYSDIAIGSALLLGFRINENFHAPYKARSIQDFWRRWHISLSTWLRDYLYVPLGGNRRGAVRTYVNLAIVMLLGGLWHGAGWTFVIWGAMHGVWLGVNRWWQRRGFGALPGVIGHVASVLLTFHLVCLAWVFFAAKDLNNAVNILKRIGTAGTDGWFALPQIPLSIWFAFGLGYVLHFLPVPWKNAVHRAHRALPAFVVGVLWAILFGLLAYSETDAQPFIYFQF